MVLLLLLTFNRTLSSSASLNFKFFYKLILIYYSDLNNNNSNAVKNSIVFTKSIKLEAERKVPVLKTIKQIFGLKIFKFSFVIHLLFIQS